MKTIVLVFLVLAICYSKIQRKHRKNRSSQSTDNQECINFDKLQKEQEDLGNNLNQITDEYNKVHNVLSTFTNGANQYFKNKNKVQDWFTKENAIDRIYATNQLFKGPLKQVKTKLQDNADELVDYYEDNLKKTNFSPRYTLLKKEFENNIEQSKEAIDLVNLQKKNIKINNKVFVVEKMKLKDDFIKKMDSIIYKD